jgi:hypothetical protein
MAHVIEQRSIGGKIIIFQSAMPNISTGKLRVRYANASL